MSETGPRGGNEMPGEHRSDNPGAYPAEAVFRYGPPDPDKLAASFQRVKKDNKGNHLARYHAMDIHLGFSIHTWLCAVNRQADPLLQVAYKELVEQQYEETRQYWQDHADVDHHGVGQYKDLKADLDKFMSRTDTGIDEIMAMVSGFETKLQQSGYQANAPTNFAQIAEQIL